MFSAKPIFLLWAHVSRMTELIRDNTKRHKMTSWSRNGLSYYTCRPMVARRKRKRHSLLVCWTMRYCVLKYATATPIYVMSGVKALTVLADSYIIANNNGSLSSAVYLQKFSFLTHRRRYCRAPNVKRQCCPSVCMSHAHMACVKPRLTLEQFTYRAWNYRWDIKIR